MRKRTTGGLGLSPKVCLGLSTKRELSVWAFRGANQPGKALGQQGLEDVAPQLSEDLAKNQISCRRSRGERLSLNKTRRELCTERPLREILEHKEE